MTTLTAVPQLLVALQAITTVDDLAVLLLEAAQRLGFRHFAMVQHVNLSRPDQHGFRLHNYPEPWVAWFDQERLGLTDPVHRASHRSLTGFRWSDVARLVPLSNRDRQVLQEASSHGLIAGYTVPAHVPGELLGSFSFANPANDEGSPDQDAAANLVGQFAFEASRRMTAPRPLNASLTLTSRQLDCVMLVGRGKTDAEIARILDISQNTVTEHLKHARERYNAAARSVLPVRALYDGALSFADMLAG